MILFLIDSQFNKYVDAIKNKTEREDKKTHTHTRNRITAFQIWNVKHSAAPSVVAAAADFFFEWITYN